jgi:hypothetical protein
MYSLFGSVSFSASLSVCTHCSIRFLFRFSLHYRYVLAFSVSATLSRFSPFVISASLSGYILVRNVYFFTTLTNRICLLFIRFANCFSVNISRLRRGQSHLLSIFLVHWDGTKISIFFKFTNNFEKKIKIFSFGRFRLSNGLIVNSFTRLITRLIFSVQVGYCFHWPACA